MGNNKSEGGVFGFIDWLDNATKNIEDAVDNPTEQAPKKSTKPDIDVHTPADEALIIEKVCAFIENNSKLHPSMIIAGLKQGLWKGE